MVYVIKMSADINIGRKDKKILASSKANLQSNAISIVGLKKDYPEIKGYKELLFHPFRKKRISALDGVDLEVKEGQCFCILGPNGAGKTTIIKILAGLVIPDEGKAFVNGFDVEKEPEKAKASIGYAISEERSFYWRLTGRQNLEFFAHLNNIPSSDLDRKINEVLELTNLSKAADLRFNTYSTGMRQMIAFARALLSEARILCVDEPTKSMDPEAAERIREFLRKEMVEKQHRTVFWATHNLAEAQEFAHELAIIDKGKIKIKGSVRQLTEDGKVSLKQVYKRAVEKSEEQC